MSLEKQVVGVTFTHGLDTQSDKRIVLPGKLVELQNATLAEEDTIKRRNGDTIIATGTAISGLATLGDQLLALDGSTLNSYSSAAQTTYAEGTLDNLTLGLQQIVRGTGGQDSYDCATSGGYTCYVWRDFTAAGVISGCKVVIHDEATGASVLPEQYLKTGTAVFCPRVVVADGAFFIFYGNLPAPPGTLYGRVVLLTAPATLGAETALSADLSGRFDACAVGSATYVYYLTNDATASTRASAILRSGSTPVLAAGPVQVTSQAALPDGNVAGVAIASFASTLPCLIGVYAVANTAAASPGLWAGVITSAVAISVASAQKDATAAALSSADVTAVLNGSTMFVYSDDIGRNGEATATARLVRRSGFDSANAITSASVTWLNSMTRPNGTNGPFIAGKAFLVGSTVYVPMFILEAGTGTLQNAWFLFNDSARVVARALYGTSGPPSTLVNNLGSALAFSSTSVGVLVGQRTFLAFANGVNVSATGMARLTLDFSASDPLVRAPIGPALCFANGTLSIFDGYAATEAAFNLFPEVVSAVQGAAGGVVTVGAHQIVALYEVIDGAGQRHQSAPSVPITYTAADSTHHCAVTIPTLSFTQKTGVNIAVFATEAAGTVFYRLNAVNAPLANSTTAPTVTYDFNVSDANLVSGELLYTTGGILPNNSPPPCSALAIHQDRVFINPSDDPFAVQYSQPWVQGFGVQWNEQLRFYVESTGGKPSAFASMDDKLIVFRPRKIGVLYGTGPGTTGVPNGYNLVDLPVDVGCSEPRSVLVLPEGILFKSTSKGWYRLGRDLQLQWIGEGVQEFDSAGITSAVLLDTIRECRFTTATFAVDSLGNQVFYELRYAYAQKGPDGVGQWCVDKRDRAFCDAVWWAGGNSYVKASATAILKELPPTAPVREGQLGYTYGDFAAGQTTANGGTSPEPNTGFPIPLVFRTGWLEPGDVLQGFERIWRILFTGEAAGHPQPGSTLKSGVTALATVLEVWDTSVFIADQAAGGGLTIGLGTANYETTSAYAITDATHLTLNSGCANAHLAGATVRGTRVFGARGTLRADFYFDGNETTPGFSSTISDVNELVNGNSWEVRFHMAIQKCSMVMVKVTSTPPSIPAQSAGYADPGGCLNFSGMTMELGVKRGARKLPASKSG